MTSLSLLIEVLMAECMTEHGSQRSNSSTAGFLGDGIAARKHVCVTLVSAWKNKAVSNMSGEMESAGVRAR